MALPELTAEEKSLALAKAQEMRSKRTEIRRNLKQRKMTLLDVLAQADNEVVAKMRVLYLLESLPRVGKVTARKIMDEIGIGYARRVQGLGVRQMEALIEKFANK